MHVRLIAWVRLRVLSILGVTAALILLLAIAITIHTILCLGALPCLPISFLRLCPKTAFLRFLDTLPVASLLTETFVLGLQALRFAKSGFVTYARILQLCASLLIRVLLGLFLAEEFHPRESFTRISLRLLRDLAVSTDSVVQVVEFSIHLGDEHRHP